MPHIAVTRRWLLTRLIMALFAFTLALNMPLTGYAKIAACRGDPILSLGPWQIQSIIEIDAPLESVARVDYVYYIPRTTGVAVFYDTSPLAAKEHVQIIQQSGLLVARVEVKVSLVNEVAPATVTTSTTFTNSSTGRVTTRTASGLSGQTLVISAR